MVAQLISQTRENKVDIEDAEPRKTGADSGADSLAGENLDLLSVEELKRRVSLLKREIGRTEAMIASKQSSHSEAEKFFKK